MFQYFIFTLLNSLTVFPELLPSYTLEGNYDTEKANPQHQSDSQRLEPVLFPPQNDFEKTLSTTNSSPEVNNISQDHHSKIKGFPAYTTRTRAKSQIEEPFINLDLPKTQKKNLTPISICYIIAHQSLK
ncbi:hypothetical protein O181_015461 [Austropuccinia psidii MF-1]|uniref:Uncharacterized protein n=1 Tax=Austropuccinia psidii MF-1 TaxID=1389203 RepID=A0A9Q3C3T1_9BASI|nr:hypothetical protein [Austropuccinia psidii MF-1]